MFSSSLFLPEGGPTIAHQFIGGYRRQRTPVSPGGTAEACEASKRVQPSLRGSEATAITYHSTELLPIVASGGNIEPLAHRILQPSLRDLPGSLAPVPTNKLVGYCRPSLREEER